MASVFTAQKARAAQLDTKGKGKRKADDMDVEDEVQQPKQKRNKQRVLLLSSRGVTHRMRHLMNDLEALLPHVKKGKVVALLTIPSALNYLRFKTRFEVPATSPA
jgi:ribosome biogenesis protein BRX1